MRSDYAYCLKPHLLEGDILEARVPPEDAWQNAVTDEGALVSDGQLYFGEGSLRGLAAGAVFIAALLVYKNGAHDFSEPQVVTLISSLMKIPTTRKSMDVEQSREESLIARVLSQNKAAKTQAVSSWQWAVMLKALGEGVTYNDLMDKYNNHPEVVALKGEAEDTQAST
jgi:hypothetical protein